MYIGRRDHLPISQLFQWQGVQHCVHARVQNSCRRRNNEMSGLAVILAGPTTQSAQLAFPVDCDLRAQQERPSICAHL